MTTNPMHGLKIAETILGDAGKPPVLMLHGWGADRSLIKPFADVLVRQGYRAYIPDLPGFGESPPPPTAWSVYDYADFALHYADSHGLEKFFLFGHSFGGRLSLILGAKHGDRIRAMALSGAAGLRSEPSSNAQFRLKTYKALRDGLKNIGLGGLSEQLRQWYNGKYGSADFQATSGIMREVFVKVVNEDLSNCAAQIRVPTLLIWGDADDATPLSQGQRLEQLIPDAGLVILSGGHYIYLEHTLQVAKTINALFTTA